jgi:hypothetical protein
MAGVESGEAAMTLYRLYYIQDARLTGTDEFEADDDAEAFAMAGARARPHMHVEVWKAGRKIHVAEGGSVVAAAQWAAPKPN